MVVGSPRVVTSPGLLDNLSLALLVLLKCHQQLGYLPSLAKAPRQVAQYLCRKLELPSATALRAGIPWARQRHRDAIQRYLNIQPYSHGGHKVAAGIIRACAYTMSDPADLINAPIEQLIEERYELPGYSM